MTRRRALVGWGLGLLGPLALAGCGFQLRKPPKLAFETLHAPGGFATPVAQELRRALEQAGVRLLPPVPPRAPEAPAAELPDVVLDVLADQRERAVVGITATGQVRELQLRTRFRFRLRSGLGADLIDDTELLQTRDISFTETAVLGKEAEEALMYKDMQTDIVQQVLRRLSFVKP
ncbi:LPS-assembly lipoprotein LptE [Hydrogenophaga sp. OTU3427]|uniref:LPS-assembly lipoprotein LptE n=1 Tax=Hydrogenophaga sp. OTU3427 TaxID=3043856 RepID=UPI00313AAB10